MMSTKIVVCSGKRCVQHNGEKAIEAIAESIRREAEQLEHHHVEVSYGKCTRSCRKGCVVTTLPDLIKYTKVTPSHARDIVLASVEEEAHYVG